jgi:hypothetical protein
MKIKFKFYFTLHFKFHIYEAKEHAKYQIYTFITKDEVKSVTGKFATVQFNNQKIVKATD